MATINIWEGLSIYAIISIIIGFVLSFFNKEIGKYEENKEMYYKNILVPFFHEYKKDRDIDVITFYETKILRYEENEYIPSYIHFLGKEQHEDNNDNLRKTILVDYLRYTPSLKNASGISYDSILDRISFIMSFFLVVTLAFLNVFIIILIILAIANFVLNGTIFFDNEDGLNNIYTIIFMTLFSGIFYGYCKISHSYLYKHDLYSFKIKDIKRTIASRIKIYEKIKEELYFMN